MLQKFIGDRTSGFLFRSKNGFTLLHSNVLEAFLASTPQTTGATEIVCSRISPVQGDMAEKAARARRLDSFLARPCKQERHRHIQQVEGGRTFRKKVAEEVGIGFELSAESPKWHPIAPTLGCCHMLRN